jgi:hypothetical protein
MARFEPGAGAKELTDGHLATSLQTFIAKQPIWRSVLMEILLYYCQFITMKINESF